MRHEKSGAWPLVGGLISAITASLCCLGPLVLVMLGISGAWIASLSQLEPLRPYALGLAVAFLGWAGVKIYRPSADAACAPDSICALPKVHRAYKILFWLVASLILLALLSPYLAPLFY